jgi:hypothetical protein
MERGMERGMEKDSLGFLLPEHLQVDSPPRLKLLLLPGPGQRLDHYLQLEPVRMPLQNTKA